MRAHRRQPLYLAFLAHRLSGLALALFLPLHFWVLGRALAGEAALDRVLHWTSGPWFKFAEFGLVFLLALHLFGGLRLLALENLAWREPQKTLAALALAAAFFVGCGFLLRAF